MQFLFCPCCNASLPLRKPGFVRFSCQDCLAWLRIDYRNTLIRNIRRFAVVPLLALYMYLLYEAHWGYAILVVATWRRCFYEVVALFAPKLEVIVVSRPLLPHYRELATRQGLVTEDFGTTIHPMGLS
jgi:hypothetical protein